jgi:glutamate dehydrogenase/leucine dehydrogenase
VGVFDRMAEHGHEQVVFCFDRQTGMRAIIAIHDTALGRRVAAPGTRRTPPRRTRSRTPCGSPRA